jgi:hypothetical protein
VDADDDSVCSNCSNTIQVLLGILSWFSETPKLGVFLNICLTLSGILIV